MYKYCICVNYLAKFMSNADPTKKINDTNQDRRPLMFPSDLGADGHGHVLQLNIFKYQKEKIDKFDLTHLLKTIRLPSPQRISTPDMLQWDEFSAPTFGSALEAFESLGTKKSALSSLAGIPANIISDKLKQDSSLLQAQSGKTLNPRTTNVFKSPKPREFQVELSLVARNQRESIEINKIINLLRYHAYPEYASNTVLFIAPEVFHVRYLVNINGQFAENPFLPKPLPSALVGINVDENSHGEATYFKNTFAPVERKITMMFKELEIDTKASLKERYGDNA